MKVPSWFQVSSMALPVPPIPGVMMFRSGLEVPPNWVVEPYGPTASESKGADQTTICAFAAVFRPLNAAHKHRILNLGGFARILAKGDLFFVMTFILHTSRLDLVAAC